MATIIEDTRQQAGKHSRKHEDFERMGHTLIRSKLHVGDYARPPARAVDTKKDIAELAADIWQQHDRFRRELQAAQDAGTELTILVENRLGITSIEGLAGWREGAASAARRGRNAKPIDGMTLAKACKTMAKRYGARFEFCAPGDAAARIAAILGGDDDGGDG